MTIEVAVDFQKAVFKPDFLHETWFCWCDFRDPELVLLDMQSVPAGQEGWLAFDVTSASNHWLLQPRSNLGIRLYVETEDGKHLIMHRTKKKSNNRNFNLMCNCDSDYCIRVKWWFKIVISVYNLLCALFLSQTAHYLQAGWVWWAAEGRVPNSLSWWHSSEPARPPAAHLALSDTIRSAGKNTKMICLTQTDQVYLVRAAEYV